MMAVAHDHQRAILAGCLHARHHVRQEALQMILLEFRIYMVKKNNVCDGYRILVCRFTNCLANPAHDNLALKAWRL